MSLQLTQAQWLAKCSVVEYLNTPSSFQLKSRKKPPVRVGNGFEAWLPPCGRIILQLCSNTKARGKLGQPSDIFQPSSILLVRSCSVVIISWGNGDRANVGLKIETSR